jgi:hypothetical protein
LDFRFWILDWGMPDQPTVPEIEIMPVQTKMILEVLLIFGSIVKTMLIPRSSGSAWER